MIPHDVANMAPAAVGSAAAAAYSKYTDKDQPWWLLIVKWITGALIAIHGTKPVADYFSWAQYQGLIGMVLGLLAMAGIIKAWETIGSIKGAELFATLVEWIRKVAGLPPKGGPNG